MPPEAGQALTLWAPADLEPLTRTPAASDNTAIAAEAASRPEAIEVDRIVPPSGNMTVGPRIMAEFEGGVKELSADRTIVNAALQGLIDQRSVDDQPGDPEASRPINVTEPMSPVELGPGQAEDEVK